MRPLPGFLNNPDLYDFGSFVAFFYSFGALSGSIWYPIILGSYFSGSLSKYFSNETTNKFFEQSILNFHDVGPFGALSNSFGGP